MVEPQKTTWRLLQHCTLTAVFATVSNNDAIMGLLSAQISHTCLPDETENVPVEEFKNCHQFPHVESQPFWPERVLQVENCQAWFQTWLGVSEATHEQ